jgi:hypothetical protein
MATVNITVMNDADFYRTFVYQTTADVPIDITGASMQMMLRRHARDEVALLRLGTDTGEIVLIDAVNGKFTVRITQYELERLDLGDYDHSLIMTRGGMKTSIWSGILTNNPGPSR